MKRILLASVLSIGAYGLVSFVQIDTTAVQHSMAPVEQVEGLSCVDLEFGLAEAHAIIGCPGNYSPCCNHCSGNGLCDSWECSLSCNHGGCAKDANGDGKPGDPRWQ